MLLLAAITEEWDKAEEAIKLAEQVTSDVIIPAVAELRYAGRRIVDALNALHCGKGDDAVTALIADAKFSCHRARHDAVDAALSKIAIDLDLLAQAMGYDVVHSGYPDFVNYLVRLDDARHHIAESRRHREDRDAIYAALAATDFPALVEDYKELRRSEFGMRIIVARKRLGVWVGIIAGLIIAVPGYGMSWYFWKHPVLPPAAATSTTKPVIPSLRSTLSNPPAKKVG